MTAMVHIEGENGPGWMVPARKSWEEMTGREQTDFVLREYGISCPGWCSGEHFFAAAGVLMHVWDHIDSGLFTVSMLQADQVIHGNLVRRDLPEIDLAIDYPESDAESVEMQAALDGLGQPHDEFHRWLMDENEAVELAEKIRTLPHDWAPRMADGLVAVASRVREPRRANGVEWYWNYDRTPD